MKRGWSVARMALALHALAWQRVVTAKAGEGRAGGANATRFFVKVRLRKEKCRREG